MPPCTWSPADAAMHLVTGRAGRVLGGWGRRKPIEVESKMEAHRPVRLETKGLLGGRADPPAYPDRRSYVCKLRELLYIPPPPPPLSREQFDPRSRSRQSPSPTRTPSRPCVPLSSCGASPPLPTHPPALHAHITLSLSRARSLSLARMHAHTDRSTNLTNPSPAQPSAAQP
jgi:hypothetical protein